MKGRMVGMKAVSICVINASNLQDMEEKVSISAVKLSA